ncbi:MAG: hypothetical protein LQ341_006238 [Variospora aurantia]|nr:MAG: hypothetical protein LQ341_006238 [Variospora aurantia]
MFLRRSRVHIRQIAKILAPWRTVTQREVADYSTMGPAIWLRTHYGSVSNLKHEMLVYPMDMDNAVYGDYQLLNDPRLYNYGADWRRIWEVFSEMLEPNDCTWSRYEELQREAVEAFKAYMQQGGVPRVAEINLLLVHNLTGGGIVGGPGFQGQELEDEVARALQSQEALEIGKVTVIFVDVLRNVIRSSRVEAGAVEGIGGSWAASSWTELDEWAEGRIWH